VKPVSKTELKALAGRKSPALKETLIYSIENVPNSLSGN
jgi:hypothetical protein